MTPALRAKPYPKSLLEATVTTSSHPLIITLDLPSPPPGNTYYRNYRGRMVLSVRGRDFKAGVYSKWVRTFTNTRIAFPTGTVSVSLAWRRPRKSGDIDSIAKATLDALIGLAFTDDNQVVELHLTRTDDKAHPGCTVTIQRATA